MRLALMMSLATLVTGLAYGTDVSLVSQAPIWSAKPDLAAFETMENERLAAAQRSIDRLVSHRGPRTVENTLVPYDDAIREIDSASDFSGLMQQLHPDEKFRDAATAMTTRASGVQTALLLNGDVYRALGAIDLSKADAATRYYVKRQLLEFRLAGVDKDAATRQRIKKLQDELTEALSIYDRNISDDSRVVVFDSAQALEGLPQDYIDRHKPDTDGKIRITTRYPDLFPVLTFARSADTRRRLWEAFNSRAYPKNREVLEKIMKTRYQLATLNGYSAWPDYDAADRMIGNGANIGKFIEELDAAVRPTEQREYALLLAEKRKVDPAATDLYAYETWRLKELVGESQYGFDAQSVRPYLPYPEVKQGVLDTAAALFHVTFTQEIAAPAWDPKVETWDVFDEGKAIGRFYLDMHPRKGKYSHAAMAPVLDGVRGRQLPEAALMCNFPEPTADDPGLMDIDDATTFFHEFGHLMHHILGGQQPWAGISGISMERDFVEAPSQMLEEWMQSPQVLATFARHYKTGEPIPAELVARMNRASAFGRASDVAIQNALADVSYQVYRVRPQKVDLEALTDHALQRYTLYKPIPEDRRLYANFTHLGNYSSAYYTYMWDKVIAEDFFAQFDPKNPLAGSAPMRYRRIVLEPGGSKSANELVRNFLGRPQNLEAFQTWLGREFAGQSQTR